MSHELQNHHGRLSREILQLKQINLKENPDREFPSGQDPTFSLPWPGSIPSQGTEITSHVVRPKNKLIKQKK